MMFAKENGKLEMVATDRCAVAESVLDAFVRFSISRNAFIFCIKD